MHMAKSNNEEREYKDFEKDESYIKVKELKDEVSEVRKELVEQLKDPQFQAYVMYKLANEKENSNRVLKGIMQKLESLEERIQNLEGGAKAEPKKAKAPEILAEQDERILGMAKKEGKLCAEDVRKALGYKGKNAASARLNKLVKMGLLKKTQAGRKVYFLPI